MIDRPIRVEIDRLILTGRNVTPEEAAEIRSTVETQLASELAGPTAATNRSTASPPAEPGTPFDPGHVSAEIARAISPAIEPHMQKGGD